MLSDAILGGALEPGSEIVQTELAETLGVSRMPVREALIILELEGLVERLPNNHAKVVDFDGPALESSLGLCRLIETEVLRSGGELPPITSEEEFHLAMLDAAPPGLGGRAFRSGAETILSFALRCDAHDTALCFEFLRRAMRCAVAGDTDGVGQAMEGYYDQLAREVREERRQ